jgi:predicted transcriptional regulator
MSEPEPRDDFQTISDAELGVVKKLWQHGPATPAEVRELLAEDGSERAYTTVQTLLHRLLRKGYVERREAGAAQAYVATVDQETLLQGHMEELARRVCDGHAGPLMLGLVRSNRLSRKELDELRALLDQQPRSAPRKPRKQGGA